MFLYLQKLLSICLTNLVTCIFLCLFLELYEISGGANASTIEPAATNQHYGSKNEK